jgi:hypothetical protein
MKTSLNYPQRLEDRKVLKLMQRIESQRIVLINGVREKSLEAPPPKSC